MSLYFVWDDTEENSSDGSQAPKRRRMGSGDSSRSCDTSSHEVGYELYCVQVTDFISYLPKSITTGHDNIFCNLFLDLNMGGNAHIFLKLNQPR